VHDRAHRHRRLAVIELRHLQFHVKRKLGDHRIERFLRAGRLLLELSHFFAQRVETGLLFVQLLGVALQQRLFLGAALSAFMFSRNRC